MISSQVMALQMVSLPLTHCRHFYRWFCIRSQFPLCCAYLGRLLGPLTWAAYLGRLLGPLTWAAYLGDSQAVLTFPGGSAPLPGGVCHAWRSGGSSLLLDRPKQSLFRAPSPARLCIWLKSGYSRSPGGIPWPWQNSFLANPNKRAA